MEPETSTQPPVTELTEPPHSTGRSLFRRIFSRRNFARAGLGCLALLVIVALTSPPMIVSPRKKADQTQAISNLRQIGMALFEFESDYGQFPDAATIETVKTNTGTNAALTDESSNTLFRQLIAGGMLQSEEPFYAHVPGSRKPDNVTAAGKLLERGECGFAYVAGFSTAGDSSRPLIVAPLIPGTLKFDPVPFEGKAVVLCLDNSVKSYSIDKGGRVMGLNGMDIFDPRQPYWAGKAPDVKWPDLLPVAESPEPPKDYSGEIIFASAAGILLITGGWFVYLLKRAAIPPELSSDAK